VARRIDIELTSARPDGTWTWRAAGALNPRGVLPGSLLYEGAKAGDVVRAEAEFDLEGISVVAVEAPRPREQPDPNRIELVGRAPAPEVTTQLARSRPGPGGRPEHRRPAQPHLQPGPVPRAGAGRDHPADRPRLGGPAGERPAGGPERRARRELGERPARAASGPERHGPGRPRPERARPEAAEVADLAGGHRPGAPAGTGNARRARRLNPGNAHRSAMLESLPPEHQPVAQQLLRGGIPAVRTALYFERERAREEGRPEPSTEGVLALAESLLPRVKAAEWRDRAEAALKAGDDLSMRDLRTLVGSSDVARDEASRELAAALREMLERRIDRQWAEWQDKVTAALGSGQVLQALRLSSRPPEVSARFPADLATRLRDAAGAAMSPSTPPDQWLALLQAVVESPVRRTVKPAGLPEHPTPELLEAARQHCGQVPALAPLLGISVPPPPGPARPARARRTFGSPARLRPRSGLHPPSATGRPGRPPSDGGTTGAVTGPVAPSTGELEDLAAGPSPSGAGDSTEAALPPDAQPAPTEHTSVEHAAAELTATDQAAGGHTAGGPGASDQTVVEPAVG